MKKFFLYLSIAAVTLCLASCEKEKGPNVDELTEDGFYVALDPTGQTAVTEKEMMANGINEAADQSLREGMYEKYIVLDADKEFSLAYISGGKMELYGASLSEFKPADLTGIYDSNPADAVFKGKLEIGDNAPKMKVSKKGLYHIVLDLNKKGDLAEAQIVLCPVTMGVRGGMNSWGFTAMNATEPSNEGITYTLSGQELGNNGEFKFAYNSAWKITLDSEGAVKANTNLGKDCKPGGDNIAVTEGAGKYSITLTFKLAAGDIAKSFKYEIKQEEKANYPEHVYMIGQDFGSWSWDNAGVVDLPHVSEGGNPLDGAFVVTRYFLKDSGFKFSTAKDWGMAFGKMTTNSSEFTFDGDGNAHVPADGLWTITLSYAKDEMTLTPGMIYGMGPAFNDDWTTGKFPGVVNADGTASITTLSAGALRVYAPCAFDWWQHEFQPTADGKIQYREGGELEAFNAEAGVTYTFDFNAGTVTVGEGGGAASPIKIDGDPSDWEGVENVNSLVCPDGAAMTALKSAKILYSDKLYFLVELSDEALADGKVRLHVYFDTDDSGQVQQSWNSADIDYMTEGKMTNGGAFVEYSSSLYKWTGSTPGEWAWGDSGAELSFQSAGKDHFYELAIDYTNYPGGLPEEFPIAIDVVYSDWGVHGFLPQTPNKLVIKKDGIAEQPGIIRIDGDMSDWADIEGTVLTPTGNEGEEGAQAIWEVKGVGDANNIYVYVKRSKLGRWTQLFGSGNAGYYYFDFDLDNNPDTGEHAEHAKGSFESWCYLYIFGGSADAPEFRATPPGEGHGMSIENIKCNGCVTADAVEVEVKFPRADLAEITGDTVAVSVWGNKDGNPFTKAEIKIQ